jgi:transposase
MWDQLKDLGLHLVVDNYATHKHPKVKAWLKRHPRFHLHFTPTSASWINQVERFFGLINRRGHPPRRVSQRRRPQRRHRTLPGAP